MSGDLGDTSESPAESSGDATPTPFEVIDALGWFRLHRRAADLDGSVPLRAARACLPLLEGNGYGWQLSARRPITVRRRMGRWQLADADLVRVARGCIPYLTAHGFLRGRWAELFADGPLAAGRGFVGGLALWTGLLVRASAGVVRVSHGGNRRNRDITIGESFVHETADWVPLVVELGVATTRASFVLAQEIATVSAMAPTTIDLAALQDHTAIGSAHLSFFDATYFEEKQRGPTKKYRALVSAESNPREGGGMTVVRAGPEACAIELDGRRHDVDGPRTQPTVPRVVVRNLVPFSAHEDGSTVHIDPDARALAAVASEIEATWSRVFDGAALAGGRGAMWYLTKYFTPHVTGEPHFFVKPPALFATAAGISLLVDGIHGVGYDVLRGVIRSDRFHAAPAVFAVDRGATIAVGEGAPLCRLLPISAHLDRAEPRWHAPLPTAVS